LIRLIIINNFGSTRKYHAIPGDCSKLQNLSGLGESSADRCKWFAIVYERRNVLNLDEKLTPNRTLATEQSSGGKKLTDRITIGFTCSAEWQ
jgi:hypothetical protein